MSGSLSIIEKPWKSVSHSRQAMTRSSRSVRTSFGSSMKQRASSGATISLYWSGS